MAVFQKPGVDSLSEGTEGRVTTTGPRSRRSMYITDEVCMHAKDSKLLSLATKIDLS